MIDRKAMNVVLVGPMGSGKTSVGRRLACVLKRDFFDSDFEIVARTGVAIDHIFDVEGEEGFRQREINMLSELCEIPNIVIATGGGIVIKPENRELLKRDSFVVYLSSSIKHIYFTLTKALFTFNIKYMINGNASTGYDFKIRIKKITL
jgi:shikimate kinase